MTDRHRAKRTTGRRDFLLQVSAGAAASGMVLGHSSLAAEPEKAEAAPMPTIQLGEHRVSRLVAGANPIGGHSHTTLNMARVMREYFTVEQTVEFLQTCEREGINTWQSGYREKEMEALKTVRERGSKLKFICLHAERGFDAPVETIVPDVSPIAIVHHGGVTDALFRADKQQNVHDYVKKVHDLGVLAGVSAHKPDNIKYIVDEGWEVDLFMTCFYYVTRPREAQLKQLGKVTVGEPFFESDPVDMTEVARQVDQPCLGFKILAAGRSCWSKYSVEKAFKFAFENIKPSDGVIVGMFPKYHDEVGDNVMYTRKHGAV